MTSMPDPSQVNTFDLNNVFPVGGFDYNGLNINGGNGFGLLDGNINSSSSNGNGSANNGNFANYHLLQTGHHHVIPEAVPFPETSVAVQNVESPKKRGRSGAFSKECILSPELATFLGKDRMTRSEVVSNMWRTIRERGLIDVNQKQFANCDDDLFKVIGKKRFKVFGMMKYLKDHIRDPSKKT